MCLQRQEQTSEENCPPALGPHMTLVYEDAQILEDAASLIIHHVKRQSGIHKNDKYKIKQLIQHFLPDILFSRRGVLSDAEDDDDDEDHAQPEHQSSSKANGTATPKSRPPTVPGVNPSDEEYHLFYVNNNWYVFLRLHQLLCSRLLRIYSQAERQIQEEAQDKEWERHTLGLRHHKSDSPACQLRLREPCKSSPNI